MKQLLIAVALMSSMSFGCAATTVETSNTSDAYQTAYQAVKNTRFDSLNVTSDYHKKQQKSVFLMPLDVSDIDIDEQYSLRHAMGKKWQLDNNERFQLQELYKQSMLNYFTSENGYSVTTDENEADYVIHADLTEINPTAPKDDMRSRQIGTKYFTQGSGSMAIAFDVYQAGQLVMKIEDKSDAGHTWEANDWSSNTFNTRVLFKKWARQLSDTL